MREVRTHSSVRRATAGRMAYAVGDQAVSSATNFVLGLLLARALPPAAFGGFVLAFAAYLLVLGLSRALGSEPLVVRAGGMDPARWHDAVAGSAGSAVLLGVLGGAALVVTGLAVGGTLGGALSLMGIVLPGVLLQDAWRFVFLAARAPRAALVNDLAWAGLLAPAAAMLAVRGVRSLAPYVLAWGSAGTVAALIGLGQTRVLPRPLGAPRWWRDQGDLAGRYAGEFGATLGAEQATLYALGGLLGLAAIGTIRTAQLLLGPVGVLIMGVGIGSVPEAASLSRRDSRRLGRACAGAGALLALAAVCWTGVLLAIPRSLGATLVPGWGAARPLFVPLGVALAAWAATTGAAIGLRAGADARRGLQARVAQAGFTVSGAVVGAVAAGPVGAAWGLAGGGWTGTVVWWDSLARHARSPAGLGPPAPAIAGARPACPSADHGRGWPGGLRLSACGRESASITPPEEVAGGAFPRS
ncbi:MAG: hypothetical protein HY775_10240 [Acidobacteria bacterium]|nr:hypothetical protein [Acidobacteriota bacterium]